MPKDHWAHEKARSAVRRAEADKRTTRDQARCERAQDWEASRPTKDRLQSPSTRLWFGKYNGKTLRQVAERDHGYIDWLAGLTPAAGNWRMKILVAYLQTSPCLAKRRMARHTGGDEAPATTNMACEIREADPIRHVPSTSPDNARGPEGGEFHGAARL